MNRRTFIAVFIAATVAVSRVKLTCERDELIVKTSGPHDLYILKGSLAAKRAFIREYLLFQEHFGGSVDDIVDREMKILTPDYRWADPGASEWALRNCGYSVTMIQSSVEEIRKTNERCYGRMSHDYVLVDTPQAGIEAWRPRDETARYWPMRFSERYPVRKNAHA
jgi:hypothetical protein